jgi:transketolase
VERVAEDVLMDSIANPTNPPAVAELVLRARALRMSIIRTHAAAGQGHLGSALSIVEILIAIFASGINTGQAGSPRGDRVVLSKGHAALALYCVLAEAGMLDRKLLPLFGHNGSPLEPHPNELLLPVLHASTGSLGQGLSIGLGLSYGSRLAGVDESCFVILGDGELNEGQPWEAAIAAPYLRLGNLIAIVDANRMQQDGSMGTIMPLAGLSAAWKALGWRVEQVDGHDTSALVAALAIARRGGDCPTLIVAETIKCRGIPFLEGTVESHYPPPLDRAELALIEKLVLG